MSSITLSILILIMILILGYVAGKIIEFRRAKNLVRNLQSSIHLSPSISLEIAEDLPPPVVRYLKRALPDPIRPIQKVFFEQTGELRTNTSSHEWMAFSATQMVSPLGPGFVWNAKVRLPLGLHVRVLDHYDRGVGGGQVSFISALRLSSVLNEMELNSGALHRYLAESVWYPCALLPQFGVTWQAKDDQSAIATKRDRGVEVSLEFRFNDADEVIGIFSPGRWGRFGNRYEKVAWEGHFSHYEHKDGYRIPTRGEVGWYDQEELKLVWKGSLNSIHFE